MATKRSTSTRRPPKPHAARSPRAPTPATPPTKPPAREPLVRKATVALHTAESAWRNVADSVDGEGSPIEQVWLAVHGALRSLVRLLDAGQTPERDALLKAARALEDERELDWFAEMGLEPPAEPRPPRPSIASTSTAPLPDHLDFANADAVRRFLVDLRVALDDADAVTLDALRPLGKRELGRTLHRKNYGEAREKIAALLAYATPPAPDGQPRAPAARA